jgi:hypothetical protein
VTPRTIDYAPGRSLVVPSDAPFEADGKLGLYLCGQCGRRTRAKAVTLKTTNAPLLHHTTSARCFVAAAERELRAAGFAPAGVHHTVLETAGFETFKASTSVQLVYPAVMPEAWAQVYRDSHGGKPPPDFGFATPVETWWGHAGAVDVASGLLLKCRFAFKNDRALLIAPLIHDPDLRAAVEAMRRLNGARGVEDFLNARNKGLRVARSKP